MTMNEAIAASPSRRAFGVSLNRPNVSYVASDWSGKIVVRGYFSRRHSGPAESSWVESSEPAVTGWKAC